MMGSSSACIMEISSSFLLGGEGMAGVGRSYKERECVVRIENVNSCTLHTKFRVEYAMEA